jgi:hypothetical protein
MKGFTMQASRYSNLALSILMLEDMKRNGIIIPTHSLKYFEIIIMQYQTYHSFAITKMHDTG